MATSHSHPPQRLSGFDSWKDGIDKADEKWNAHDLEIKAAVQDYEFHLLSTTPGFPGLDWRLVKAMLWVESGARDSEWKIKPMQIGARLDLGLPALLGNIEGGWLIVPPSYLPINESAVKINPRDNIRAGIGYLLMKMANFDIQTVMDRDTHIYEVTAMPKDNLDRIARANGSTVDVLVKLNPAAHVLREGQVLKLRKASRRKIVTGWKSIDLWNIARYYNGGGDPLYAQKLKYAWETVRRGAAL